MKITCLAVAFLIVVPSVLTGQEASGDRVVIPARASSRPRVVNISTMDGGVTVKAYSGKEVIVETHEAARSGRERERRRGSADMEGMKRLELPGTAGLDIDEEDNMINIRTRSGRSPHLVVSVPANTSVKVRCTNGGDIVVEGVNGEVDVNNLNGRIFLNGVSGTVIAHSLNGEIKATVDRLDPGKPISFSTLNGDVDVTLPGDLRANMKMKTDNGEIYSDFDIKLDLARNKPTTDPNDSKNGRFHMKADRALYGTINGGGPEATFTTFNGRISVRKKK